jgi:Zinc dependent phospholipase C
MRCIQRFLGPPVGLILFLCFFSCVGHSYSVLTHEQIVDLVWKDQIQPLLLKRFPGASPDDLRKAHAFAYGGSLIQDMGYYPFGNKYFSDLSHYVRTGDFVEALIEQSTDLNEYAFALGALAHYSSDNCGHPAVNRAVAIEFPELRRKFGNEVTYVDDPKAHIRTEFGFDMVQVAKNRYTSDAYHDFIGFQISKPVLERAFKQTYDLKLTDVIHKQDLAFGSFRRAISKIIPEMTKVALINRRADIVRDTPNFNKKKFLYRLKRTQYEKEWGKGYRKPGPGARVLAFVLKIVPKFGPFKALAFQIPTTQTEDMYIKSINTTIDNYTSLLRQQQSGQLRLSNLDFDTGKPARAGEYKLADQTYAHLLDDLAKRNFDQVTPDLRDNILSFYGNLNAPVATKKEKKAWVRTLVELQKLRLHTLDQPSIIPSAAAMNLDNPL